MSPERWRQIEELYQLVQERAPADRGALLAEADPEVRREVEAMLAQDASGGQDSRRSRERPINRFKSNSGHGRFAVRTVPNRGVAWSRWKGKKFETSQTGF